MTKKSGSADPASAATKSKKQNARSSSPSEEGSKLSEQARFTNKIIKDGLRNVASHHIDSFDYAMQTCLPRICKHMPQVEVQASTLQQQPQSSGVNLTVVAPFKKYSMWFESFELRKPQRPLAAVDAALKSSGSLTLLPYECRLRSLTYAAPLYATVCRRIDDEPVERSAVCLGDIPVMVRSKACNLSGMSEEELVRSREDMHEFGGYFVVNGNERLIRMLIVPKRNYPVAFERPSFCNRGRLFSPFAVQMRCVRSEDLFAQTLTLHYLTDGNCILKFVYHKQEFLVPAYVLLKAMGQAGTDGVTDRAIFERLSKCSASRDQIEVLLSDGAKLELHSQEQCMAYLGSRMRTVLESVSSELSDVEVGRFLLTRILFVHAQTQRDKFAALCLMIDKLFSFVAGQCGADNLDAVSNQEVLLGGHLYAQLLSEKLFELLMGARAKLIKDLRSPKFDAAQIHNPNYLKRCVVDGQTSVGHKLEQFLATGNLVSRSQLDLQQTAGFTIVADKLNSTRYLSHFRSIHRGQYFTEMKTTSVRKLLPEAWGFICPVHTPDGAPCGLLNHISLSCAPLAAEDRPVSASALKTLLAQFGMHPSGTDFDLSYPAEFLPVVLDGVPLGYIHPQVAPQLVGSLRKLKVDQSDTMGVVPQTLEIAYLPPGCHFSTPPTGAGAADASTDSEVHEARNYAFPGVFLSSQVARFARPVRNLVAGGTEWIGPLEQMNLSIATLREDLRADSTHQELDPLNVLSIVAATIPFCNYNQSPRNMYQCQMAKQTMGTPYHAHAFRADNKVYRLLFPQAPLVRTEAYQNYDFDQCPPGTNAVVAVISYTGYDMEDAMILNKGAFERGFAHGCVYKSYLRELNEGQSASGSSRSSRFRLVRSAKDRVDLATHELDSDGLPPLGRLLEHGKAEQCIYDQVLHKPIFTSFKDNEPARVEAVRLIGDEKDPSRVNLSYTIRYERNPVIGDKFSSRHGQKGVLSVVWPQEDMPWTESGMTPDVIINPHAFPSRMTIGMLIESLAGKGGALKGEFVDVRPFDKYEDDDVVEHFGRELVKRGYNYYGNETMYSGVQGVQMKVDIFMGLVYYQRLRHMVSDKAQARATGPYDVLTHQPVKGRKKAGGIRFGEMERDSLLAHGAAFLLNDRLMRCSDYAEGYVCKQCGSILSTYVNREVIRRSNVNTSKLGEGEQSFAVNERVFCRVCDSYDCRKVALPFVLRYLTNELAAMNIKLKFHLSEPSQAAY